MSNIKSVNRLHIGISFLFKVVYTTHTETYTDENVPNEVIYFIEERWNQRVKFNFTNPVIWRIDC